MPGWDPQLSSILFCSLALAALELTSPARAGGGGSHQSLASSPRQVCVLLYTARAHAQ